MSPPSIWKLPPKHSHFAETRSISLMQAAGTRIPLIERKGYLRSPIRNEVEHSAKKILAECSTRWPSAQYFRSIIQPNYHDASIRLDVESGGGLCLFQSQLLHRLLLLALFYFLPTSTCAAGAVAVACAPRHPNRRIANQSNVPRFRTITGMVSSKVCTPTELGSGLVAPRMIKTTCFQEDHAACAWD